MTPRPTWQGHLRLSLVTCPVALYTAVSRTSDLSFNLINPKTNDRIRMIPTDPDAGPVERSSLVKGYEDAVRDLIKAKLKGKKSLVKAEEPEDTDVKDLMAMLKQSLGQGGPARRKPAAKAAPENKRPPARKAARRA